MIQSVIHQNTRLGHVHLTVSDLERALAYYRNSLGFQLHRQEGSTAALGAGRDDLLLLTEIPGAQHPGRTTGLYHFAILVPSRLALAQSLQHMIDTNTRIGGWSDHLVSEAIYLSDPDGNGIEIYRDRPRTEWTYANEQIKMTVDPFDAKGVLAELTPDAPEWDGLHPDTILGHMHLHVAQLPQAVVFYRDVLGFGFMTGYGDSAAFLSAGGYHHHIGLNTWNGIGAPPSPPDSVGLREFTVHLPNTDELDALVGRLDSANVPFERNGTSLQLHDPSHNQLRFIIE